MSYLVPTFRLPGHAARRRQRASLVVTLCWGLLGCVDANIGDPVAVSDAAVANDAMSPVRDARVAPTPSGDGDGDDGDDAGVPGVLPDDASTRVTNNGPSAWWQPLRAQYGLRMRFFGRERVTGNAAVLRHEIVMHARVSVNAQGEVSMETQRCLDVGYIDGLIKDEFRWSFPERLPAERFGLVLRGGKVESVAEPRLLGYTSQAPAACASSAQAPKRAEQVWLDGATCECATGPLPLLANDCRVNDVDNDARPGLTVQHSNFVGTENVRVKDSCQIVDGELSSDGTIRGHYIENYDYLGLSCGSAPCGHNDIVVCPLELNPVRFVPLDDKTPDGADWDCAALLRAVDAGKVFPSEMLSFPAGC